MNGKSILRAVGLTLIGLFFLVSAVLGAADVVHDERRHPANAAQPVFHADGA